MDNQSRVGIQSSRRGMQVYLDGRRADSDLYRLADYGINIKVGGVAQGEVR